MLLSNNNGLERVKHCNYVVSNIYNLKHFYKTNEGFKRIEVKTPAPLSELMFTQLVQSQHIQRYPVLKHNHTEMCITQGSSFYTLSIEKDGHDFYIKVMDNWFIKYEGKYLEAVAKDFLFHQEHKQLVQKAVELFDERIELLREKNRRAPLAAKRPRPKRKQRAKPPSAKELAKRVAKRGKLLQKIAVDKYNKQHVSRKRR